MARRLVRSSTAVDDSDGSFMGFDSSSDSSDNSDVEKGDTHHSLDEVIFYSFSFDNLRFTFNLHLEASAKFYTFNN